MMKQAIYRSLVTGTVAMGVIFGLSNAVKATPVTYDEIVFQSPAVSSDLFASIDMSVSGTTLTILLKNTSLDSATPSGAPAVGLLTGLGFNLPTGVTITGGNAYVAGGSTAIGFTPLAGGSLGSEWGYIQPSKDGISPPTTTYSYNSAIGAVEGMITPGGTHFSGGDIDGVDMADGPDFGAVSALETTTLGGGLEAVNDRIRVVLTLSSLAGYSAADFVTFIDSDKIVVAFGSPTGSSVPDGGSTLGLLASSLIALGCFARRRYAVSNA